jgi:ribose 5-phosphate isomerase B
MCLRYSQQTQQAPRGCRTLVRHRHIWYEDCPETGLEKPYTMTKTVIALAADHAGFPLKEIMADELSVLGYAVLDLGTNGTASVDYADFGHAAAVAVLDGRAALAMICCGTGLGISMAANKYPGIRAALCHDATTARLARDHNDANILALGARVVGTEVARDCLRAFLATPFGGARHAGRVAKIDQIRTKEAV